MSLSFLAETPLFYPGVFLFGLIIGSFLNVVILRLPKMMEYEWQCQCKELLHIQTSDDAESPPTLSRPASTCPKCGHRIRAIENIPVVSYLVLRGKCRKCRTRISIRYPLIELLTAIAFTLVVWQFGATPAALLGLVFTAMLIASAGIDFDHQILPDSLTLGLLWIGLAISLWDTFTSPSEAIIGALVGYLVLWLVFHLFKLLTGKEGMGYGDFKLLAALGAWMGWQALPGIVILSSLSGAVIGTLMISIKVLKREQAIPFGPYLAAAGWVYFIWGEQITDFYLTFSGLG